MKKQIYFLSIFIILSSCSVFNTGRNLKSEKDKVTKIEDKIEVNKDSTATTTVNKAIDDKAVVKVAESNTGDQKFDVAVDNAVNKILRSINLQKSSGDNGYKFYFDEQLRELRAEIQVGQTESKDVSTNNSSNIEKSFEENVSENTKKVIKMLPWWVWILLVWFTRKSFLIPIVSIFVPGFKQISSISDLLNPPNKNNQ